MNATRTLIPSLAALIIGAWAGSAGAVPVNLIQNGDFDISLAGWNQSGGTIGTTWVDGTAHLGQPGTPGLSVFWQPFEISPAEALAVGFDFQWQQDPSTNPDTFKVELEYALLGGGTSITSLLTQTSDTSPFNTTQLFDGLVSLVNADFAQDAILRFSLNETNTPIGTRIELDNISVSAIPLPATALLLMSGLAAIGVIGRRRRAVPT